MPAPDHLSTGLFHGSSVKLKPGDIVQPSTAVGHGPYKGMYESGYTRRSGHSRGDHVYMTTQESAAWDWAKNGPSEGGGTGEGEHPVPYTERSKRVYEVRPIGGHYNPDDIDVPGGEMIFGERVTDRHHGAEVVREHIIPPPDVGVYDHSTGKTTRGPHQGQFPDVNWESQNAQSYSNSNRRRDALAAEQTYVQNTQLNEHLRDNPAPKERGKSSVDDVPLPGMERAGRTAPIQPAPTSGWNQKARSHGSPR